MCIESWSLVQELASWREEKEKEAMKNAVLDDVVASKFSTAAALASKRSQNRGVDWRDNTLATNSPPREAPKGDEVFLPTASRAPLPWQTHQYKNTLAPCPVAGCSSYTTQVEITLLSATVLDC